MADELDWLEMLVASERVEKWLRVISSSSASTAARVTALQEFAAAVQAKEAYAEEARHAGAVARLTKQLSSWADNLPLRQAAIQVCIQLELASAFRQQVSVVQYGGIVLKLKEGALGDGLGARVWVVAHTLCRHMVAQPALVAGKRVLEIGAGCGLCGMLAVKLQAAQVYLTDHEDKVLQNLRDCVAANFPLETDSGTISGHGTAAMPADNAAGQQGNDGLFDPEDAESCDDLDDLLAPASSNDAGPSDPNAHIWDFGAAHVRHLDWVQALDTERAVSDHEEPKLRLANQETRHVGCSAAQLPAGDQFDVILGTDILYEAAHAPLVAAVVKAHLCAHGQAVLCCAVREQAMFDQLAEELSRRHMRFTIAAVQPQADDQGIVGKQHDYEGGFVMVTAEHASADIR